MSILKSFGAIFGLNIFEFLIAPISNTIVTKSLSVEHYGVMGYWGAVLALVSSFSALGLGLYNYKMIPGRELDKQYFYLGRTLFIEMSVVIISSVTVSLIFQNELIKYSLFLVIILRSIIMLINTEVIRFIGYQKKNILKSIYGLLDSRLWVVFLLIFILFSDTLAINVLFTIQLFSSCLVFLSLFLIIDFKKFIGNLRPDRLIFVEGLKFGIPLIMVDLGQYLLDMGNRYLLKAFLNYESVGLYNFVSIWINVIFKFAMLFVYISQPYFAESYNKNDIKKFKSIVQLSAKYMLLICFVAGIGYIVNYEGIVLLLGKSEYLVTYKASLIMIFYPPLLGFSFILQIIGVLIGDTKKLPIIYFTSAIICLFSNFILIRKIGYIGAAVSSVIGYSSLLIGMLIAYGDKANVLKSVFIDYRIYIVPSLFFVLNCFLSLCKIGFIIILIINLALLALLVVLRILPNKSDYSILRSMNR